MTGAPMRAHFGAMQQMQLAAIAARAHAGTVMVER
jgi:hypothetical protein